MGMAAPQVRLLQLTDRKSTIGWMLSRLSNEKMALTRDMQKVSQKRQNALNQKVLKWSNNAGVSYIDLSYKNLMKPSAMNQNTPYLLTDTNGAIVIDSSYKKYAEMISQNGASGGNWDAVRTQVLSELVGVDASKFSQADLLKAEVTANENAVNKLIDEKPVKPVQTTDVAGFVKNLVSNGPINGFKNKSTDWFSAYINGDTVKLNGNAGMSELRELLNYISDTLGKYVDDPKKFKGACDNYYNSILTDKQDFKDGIVVQELMDRIMIAYGKGTKCPNTGETLYTWNDINNPKYKQWESDNNAWQANYDAAIKKYNDSVASSNQIFTAEEEILIEYYDTLFSSIAEKGWTYNDKVEDTDYLNQMLQNNLYTITTVERTSEYNDDTDSYDTVNNYSTDIASNFTNVSLVTDTDASNQALAEYEYQKSIISSKESRIDTRMEDLKTEQSAINQMLQSLEKIKNDNIEKHFNIFS